MRKLTTKQALVLRTIFDLIAESGFPPTLRELGKALDIPNPNGVRCHLRALESKGAIQRRKGARAIRLLVRG